MRCTRPPTYIEAIEAGPRAGGTKKKKGRGELSRRGRFFDRRLIVFTLHTARAMMFDLIYLAVWSSIIYLFSNKNENVSTNSAGNTHPFVQGGSGVLEARVAVTYACSLAPHLEFRWRPRFF
jgi:hypothetical protein